MWKKVAALCLVVCLGHASAWARSFSGVKYNYGYPGFSENTDKITGTIHVEQAGVSYESKDGRKFQIPAHRIREQSYETQTRTNRTTGFAVAGPNPILLATTLGVSFLGNVLGAVHPQKISEYFYRIHFLGRDNKMHEVSFQVPSESVQRSLLDEVDAVSRAEYHNVLMLQEPQLSPATPIAPPEPNSETDAPPSSMGL